MNKRDIVKKDLVRRKIVEFFSKNTKAKSCIINSNVANLKTIWRVVREGKGSFRVTEVDTKKENFIIEAPITPVGGQKPAVGSVPLGGQKPGTGGGGTMGELGASETLELIKSGMLKVTSQVAEKLFAPLLIPKDPTAKKHIKMVWDILNKATNKDAKAASFLGIMQNLMNTPAWLAASKQNKGSKLSEADDTSIKDMPQDKEDDATDPVGLDQQPPENDQTVEPSTEKSQEVMVMKKSLEGKPIESVDIEYNKDSVDLLIKSVGTDIPSKFSVYKTGKVIYTYKDRPYVLKRN